MAIRAWLGQELSRAPGGLDGTPGSRNSTSLKLPSQFPAFRASASCPAMGFRFCFLVKKARASSAILSYWVLHVATAHMLRLVDLSAGV